VVSGILNSASRNDLPATHHSRSAIARVNGVTVHIGPCSPPGNGCRSVVRKRASTKKAEALPRDDRSVDDIARQRGLHPATS